MSFITTISFGTVVTAVVIAIGAGFILGAYVTHKAHKAYKKHAA